ncbi:hypothetical protein CPLU01_02250 [Colletotrichum plurivorum]|uniref:Uncharacterized protein n=1 Tax=Colletotrichum plurivorum TaxID=2175906 RepID=A0A8H6KW16_9PEZI|nr:hypothetical protein CPLU01_02250 [Colletotrichum plurivorum]
MHQSHVQRRCETVYTDLRIAPSKRNRTQVPVVPSFHFTNTSHDHYESTAYLHHIPHAGLCEFHLHRPGRRAIDGASAAPLETKAAYRCCLTFRLTSHQPIRDPELLLQELSGISQRNPSTDREARSTSPVCPVVMDTDEKQTLPVLRLPAQKLNGFEAPWLISHLPIANWQGVEHSSRIRIPTPSAAMPHAARNHRRECDRRTPFDSTGTVFFCRLRIHVRIRGIISRMWLATHATACQYLVTPFRFHREFGSCGDLAMRRALAWSLADAALAPHDGRAELAFYGATRRTQHVFPSTSLGFFRDDRRREGNFKQVPSSSIPPGTCRDSVRISPQRQGPRNGPVSSEEVKLCDDNPRLGSFPTLPNYPHGSLVAVAPTDGRTVGQSASNFLASADITHQSEGSVAFAS